ncbi:hypothetical protein [Lactococcus cremoris]|uniref:hypothetical protein n=1 Tax=Lactococcus lactis subsp. cremoris TaxID=1359 RepID=UPI002FCACF53
MEELQAHIQLKKTDAVEDAIIVGDPARVDQVAKFLTELRELKYNRELMCTPKVRLFIQVEILGFF